MVSEDITGLSIQIVLKVLTQGVYNRLLLVPIVGGACFLRHQLAAVFNVSFGVFFR